MIFGYARVSRQGQDLEKQILQLKEAGCEKIFQEKISGTKLDRKELEKLLDQIRPNDTIIFCDLSRASRSTRDLFKLVDIIHEKGADIKSLKENWMDTTTPAGKLMFTMMAGINQFERDLISIRTKESLSVARARGRVGGRPKKDIKKIDTAIKMYNSKQHSIKEITEVTGVSKTTLYRCINSNIE